MDILNDLALSSLITQDDDCTIQNTGSDVLPEKMSLAMSYVPFQKWGRVYESDVALQRGTVFPCLDKPFIGEEAVCDE